MKRIFSIALICLTAASAFAQSGGTFQIEKSVIAAGGGQTSGGQFTLNGTIGQSLAGTNTTGANLSLLSGFWASSNTVSAPRRAPFDFDGDSRTDISVFRPAPAEWWYLRSSNGGNAAAQFGQSTDIIVPGDFTGDGKTDIAVFRPSTGFWFILRSEDGSFFSFPFGTSGDIPAPGDYDGDGRFDATVFRPSVATWFIQQSTAGTAIVQFGLTTDKPVPNAFVMP